MSGDPDWLVWAREIQATAQTGLAFTKDPYDTERYHALRDLSVRIMAEHTGVNSAVVADLFASDVGYATPKLGVRGAVFDPDGRILLVREAIDDGRWTLPGGWAEVNQTPAESVVREVFEESGYRVRATKLAAVWDRARQGHPAGSASVVKLAFVCSLEGGSPTTSLETSGCGWFAETEIPTDLSIRRTLPHQIARMFDHWRDPSLPTDFE
ncbi:MAG: NUDIX hydrolase N-terminal domain-containing protein [Rhodospirillales bacterium]